MVKITKERKLEKELFGVLLFLGGIIAVFLLASSYFKSLNQFEYQGLAFTKESLGQIIVYHHNYYFKVADKLINYNLYLRHDPRYNNVTVSGERSRLLAPGAVVYVSVNGEGLQECRYGPLAVGSISSFLSDNQMTVIGANLNFWDAGAKRDEWVTCQNRPGNRVVEILKGNETNVHIENNCYRISVANCHILEAIEKLEVQSIIDAQRIQV